MQALEAFYEERFRTMRDMKQNAAFGIRVADWIAFGRTVGVRSDRVRYLRIYVRHKLSSGVPQAVRRALDGE